MAQVRSALKIFYEEVLKQPNKVPFIPYPKQESRIPKHHSRHVILSAIDSIDNVKHKMILLTLLGTGVRVSELCSIKWCDIQRTDSKLNPLQIHVHGKGSKDRIVPMSSSLHAMLIKYCKKYSLNCDTNSDHYVFGNAKKYSVRSVAAICEKAGDLVGIKLSPHDIRHTCFFYLRDQGHPIDVIQDLAGHSNSKTTRIYAPLKAALIKMPV